jgi:FkbM family methyltransferase
MNVSPSPLEMVRRILAARADRGRNGWAVDVGAHVGAFSSEIDESGLFAGVLAFEPNRANAEALEAIARERHRIHVVRAAVGAAAGAGELHCDADSATGSLLEYRADYATNGPVTTTAVQVVTLDERRGAAPLAGNRITLVKIDTQGHDLAVLEGAGAILEADRPAVIVELIYVPMYQGQGAPADIERRLEASGYGLYSLFNIHVTREGHIAFADALFAARELHLELSRDYIQIDSHASYESQMATLQRICQDRLEVIEMLDAEVKRLSVAGAAG